jgi:glycerophosphoryl diester phosphodiesterase
MGHETDVAAGWHGSSMTHRVEIIAHRGANREAPENSVAAFEKALEIGVDGIELDVQFSRDGVPLVHHDPVIAGRPILDLSAAEAQLLKPVPALRDVIVLVNRRCRLYVEIKAPEATMAVTEMLAPHAEWCAIHSFDHRIPAVAALHSDTPAGILLVSYLVDIVGAMNAAHARDVWQQADFVDQALVATVHGAGGRVIAWTVNNADRASELISLGVDGICTDVPREILAVTNR